MTNYFSMEPSKLLKLFEEQFKIQLPNCISTIEDMENAAQLLLKLSGWYSYLNELQVKAEIYTREAKRNGDKLAYEDMVDRKKIISCMVDNVKQQYTAISRAVTIHIENNHELKMNQF